MFFLIMYMMHSLILTTNRMDALREDIINIKIPNNTELIENAVVEMTQKINEVSIDLNIFKPHTENLISGKMLKTLLIKFILKIKSDI